MVDRLVAEKRQGILQGLFRTILDGGCNPLGIAVVSCGLDYPALAGTDLVASCPDGMHLPTVYRRGHIHACRSAGRGVRGGGCCLGWHESAI